MASPGDEVVNNSTSTETELDKKMLSTPCDTKPKGDNPFTPLPYLYRHGGENVGAPLDTRVVARIVMEHGISSYRAIVAATSAILHADHGHAHDPHLHAHTAYENSNYDHRLALVTDLLYTETEYLSRLQTVLDKYAEAFRKFTSLSAEDHRVLFVGLEPIVSLSAMLVSKLDDAVESWDPSTTKIGNLFSRTYWENYEDYANSYAAIKTTLEAKSREDPTFAEFLLLRQGNSHDRLEDLLQLPVQRIPEYDKYLTELLQNTDSGHPDYVDLSRAAAKVTKMVKDREDELATMDEQKRMERVQDKFPHDDLQLDSDQIPRQLASRRRSAPGAVLFKTLGKSKSTNSLLQPSTMGKRDMELIRGSRHHSNNFNRQYLMEGNVEFSRGMQRQDRYLFLFSDLLLVAKQKSNTTFKLKHRIRVCELWIAFCIDDITELTRHADNSFVIGWPTINVVATFKSSELKETWLNKLKEQIQEERGKMVPKTLPLEVQHRESDKAIQLDVETTTDAMTIVKTCLEKLEIPDNDIKEYQLWVKLGHDESPYPLCGHELPYAIKLSHLRDFSKKPEESLSEADIATIMAEMQNNNNRKYEFFLKHNKKSPKKQSLEEIPTKQSKGKRKSPLINLFRRKGEDKKPQGQLFGHQLTSITTPEELIAKQVKEMLTILFREGPYTVGIMRKSANARTLKELKQRLDDGEDCLNTESWPPLVIGALVKDYLRSIPQSLLMEELYEDWVQSNNQLTENTENRDAKLKETLSKLPACHYDLVRHLMCVLHHIDKKSDENKMTAYNLSVCIAPSLLWPKGNPNPLATPPGVIQYMIEHCGEVFGSEALLLFGDVVEQKLRQDSSTDSDSMHSVLSTHSNFRRDDSSLDSLDREILYEGEMDSSPNINKAHHFSPSNLSADSGLILSDSQLYDEDGNGNDIINDRRNYSRSASHYMSRDRQSMDSDTSRSLENQYFDSYRYDPQNPVPPPRKARRKGSDPSISPNLEYDRKKYMAQANFSVSARFDKHHSAKSDLYKSKRHSTESLKSVEESSEADSEVNVKTYNKPRDIGTLIKSASGAHLFFEEINNPQSMFEFDNINEAESKRRNFSNYKQSTGSTMPMSPHSKYSLSSSRDSVLSDSSGSFLNRNNSPEPISSSAETPDNEDHGMSQWLSKQATYTTQKNLQYSMDDSELDTRFDNKPKMNYLVSPKTSPKLRRRSPIPLEARRSFPIQTELTPKGSGSNTSKEAEDIIKSPKLQVTYCSQDSLDKRHQDTPPASKFTSPHLDVYNNNSQMAMKQLNIYATGLQGTSPPPRVVLQGFNSQPQKRDNTPVKGDHDILSPRRRSSIDMGEVRERKPYLMQETSVSTEGESSSESEEEETVRHMTMLTLSPLKLNIPQQVIVEDKKKSSSTESLSKRHSSTESLSKSSSNSEDSLNTSRPDNPPGYDEAVQRNYLLKQGISPDEVREMDSETVRQREASMRAKQLYEQSMKQFQEQKGYSLPSQKFEKTLDALGEKHEDHSSEEETEESISEDDVRDPRKLYEESLRRYMEEQEVRQTSASPRLSKPHSKSPSGSTGLHRSHSDVADIKPRQGSRESSPSKRPDRPPPYNNPPPYHSDHTDSSPTSASRHLFPKISEHAYSGVLQKQTQQTVPHSSNSNAQNVQVPKRRDNILVSGRARNVSSRPAPVEDNHRATMSQQSGHTDNTVHSAQSEIGRYRPVVSHDRARGSGASKQSDLSPSVFRPRASSLDPEQPGANTRQAPQTSTQTPVSYRNPNVSKSSQQPVAKSQPQAGGARSSNRHSMDASVLRTQIGAAAGSKELPWSVKRLSNIFDMSKMEGSGSNPQQSQSSSVSRSSSAVSSSSQSSAHRNVSSSHNPSSQLQRTNDMIRSSMSSNSSVGSSSNGASVPSKQGYGKLGPQARDSFSSADESDCSCRYSLNCHTRDNNGIEELERINFSDITYV